MEDRDIIELRVDLQMLRALTVALVREYAATNSALRDRLHTIDAAQRALIARMRFRTRPAVEGDTLQAELLDSWERLMREIWE